MATETKAVERLSGGVEIANFANLSGFLLLDFEDYPSKIYMQFAQMR